MEAIYVPMHPWRILRKAPKTTQESPQCILLKTNAESNARRAGVGRGVDSIHRLRYPRRAVRRLLLIHLCTILRGLDFFADSSGDDFALSEDLLAWKSVSTGAPLAGAAFIVVEAFAVGAWTRPPRLAVGRGIYCSATSSPSASLSSGIRFAAAAP